MENRVHLREVESIDCTTCISNNPETIRYLRAPEEPLEGRSLSHAVREMREQGFKAARLQQVAKLLYISKNKVILRALSLSAAQVKKFTA